MKLPDDLTPRLTRAASTVAAETVRQGRRSARESASLARLWLACFVAQGAYALLTALVTGVGLVIAFTATNDSDRSIVDWVVDAVKDGELSTSTLWYTVLVLVGIGALGLLGTFVVPLFIQVTVRVTCNARVGYLWTTIANLASWITVASLSTLLWLLPGAQPFAAFFVWLGSSAMCGLLLRPRLRFITPATTTAAVVGHPVDAHTPHPGATP